MFGLTCYDKGPRYRLQNFSRKKLLLPNDSFLSFIMYYQCYELGVSSYAP
jgi:hypothetical protein